MKRSALVLDIVVLSSPSVRPAGMDDMNHGPFVSWTIRGKERP